MAEGGLIISAHSKLPMLKAGEKVLGNSMVSFFSYGL